MGRTAGGWGRHRGGRRRPAIPVRARRRRATGRGGSKGSGAPADPERDHRAGPARAQGRGDPRGRAVAPRGGDRQAVRRHQRPRHRRPDHRHPRQLRDHQGRCRPPRRGAAQQRSRVAALRAAVQRGIRLHLRARRVEDEGRDGAGAVAACQGGARPRRGALADRRPRARGARPRGRARRPGRHRRARADRRHVRDRRGVRDRRRRACGSASGRPDPSPALPQTVVTGPWIASG